MYVSVTEVKPMSFRSMFSFLALTALFVTVAGSSFAQSGEAANAGGNFLFALQDAITGRDGFFEIPDRLQGFIQLP